MKLRTLTKLTVTTSLLLLGWISSTLLTSPHSISTVSAASEDVEVWIAGPWAYAPDPRTGHKGIVLIAPNGGSIDHFAPAVQHANGDLSLATTNYAEIAITKMTSPSPCQVHCSFVSPTPVPVDTTNLVKLINKPGGNYVISLPAPDYYELAVVGESRLRYGWWDKCSPTCGSSSMQGNFATQMILHYSVTSLDGFTLNDSSYGFEDQRFIHIFMTPQTVMDPCDLPGRRTFYGLVGLFTLKSKEPLYIDLQNNGSYPSDKDLDGCLDLDPQKPSNQTSVSSLEDALARLKAYIFDPSADRLASARAGLKWVKHYGNMVPKQRQPLFTKNVRLVERFLQEKERQSYSRRIEALKNLDVAEKSVRTHDGSGACLNPMLPLNPI
jgi:hypothetical protein